MTCSSPVHRWRCLRLLFSPLSIPLLLIFPPPPQQQLKFIEMVLFSPHSCSPVPPESRSVLVQHQGAAVMLRCALTFAL